MIRRHTYQLTIDLLPKSAKGDRHQITALLSEPPHPATTRRLIESKGFDFWQYHQSLSLTTIA